MTFVGFQHPADKHERDRPGQAKTKNVDWVGVHASRAAARYICMSVLVLLVVFIRANKSYYSYEALEGPGLVYKSHFLRAGVSQHLHLQLLLCLV